MLGELWCNLWRKKTVAKGTFPLDELNKRLVEAQREFRDSLRTLANENPVFNSILNRREAFFNALRRGEPYLSMALDVLSADMAPADDFEIVPVLQQLAFEEHEATVQARCIQILGSLLAKAQDAVTAKVVGEKLAKMVLDENVALVIRRQAYFTLLVSLQRIVEPEKIWAIQIYEEPEFPSQVNWEFINFWLK